MGVRSHKPLLDRSKLCELAGIDRGKHIRWTSGGLLVAKESYGEIDLIRAAILDELTIAVRPSLAQAAWRQIEDDLDLAGKRLDVVVSPDTKGASLVRSATELDRLLPRKRRVILVELAPRIEAARGRLREFRSNTEGDQRADTQPSVSRFGEAAESAG